MKTLIVYVTLPDIETARQVAGNVVEESLAACCNLLPHIESIYRWEGTVETGRECLMMIKTTEESFAALRDRIRELHPYDLPEIIAVPVTHGLEAYLRWVEESTSTGE